MFSKEARESWKEFLSCGKYTSQLLHPSQYKQPISSATAQRRTGAVGNSGVASSTLGKPCISETLSKTDYSSETLSKTNYSSEIDNSSIIFENPLSKDGFETEVLPESSVKSETPGFETNAQRESLKCNTEKLCMQLPLIGAEATTTNRVLSEPERMTFAETNLDEKIDLGAQPMSGTAKELKPLKTRIKRYSTVKAHKHDVETVQVDFYYNSSEEEESTVL